MTKAKTTTKTKKEYLTILQITEENPTETIIKTQYRKLSKIYHTDNVKTGDKEKFILITEAKDALIDKTYFVPPKKIIFEESSSDVSYIINDKLSEFLRLAGEDINKESVKTKRIKKKSSTTNKYGDEYEFLAVKKLNAKTIIIFDLSELTENKTYIINRTIFNFKIK